MFEIESKVVCVNGSFPTNARLHAYYRNFPKKGETYTVRDIIPAQGYRGEETCAVLLAEITNPSDDPKGRGEHGFACERFREVEEIEYVDHAEDRSQQIRAWIRLSERFEAPGVEVWRELLKKYETT